MFNKRLEIKLLTKDVANKGVPYSFVKRIKRLFGINSKFNIPHIKNNARRLFNSKLKNSTINKKLNSYNKEAIQFLIESKTYRGLRHKFYLPVRGQRTHTNAKTIRKQKIPKKKKISKKKKRKKLK